MRRLTAISVALLISALSFGQELSLNEAVQLGLLKSGRIQAAKARIDEASGSRSLAKTAMRPGFGLTGSGTALDRTLEASLGPVRVIGANQWQSRLALDANIQIDISGDLKRQVRLADIGVQAAVLDLFAVRNEFVRDVRVAGLTVAQCRQLLTTARAEHANAVKRQATIAKLFEEGVVTRFDLLRSNTEVADTAQRVTVAENRERVANANLARLVEVPELELAKDVAVSVDPINADHGELIATAIRRRPELGAARLQVEAERLGVVLAGASARPSLTFGVQSYVLSNPGGFEPRSPLTGATLTLRIPFGDRGESAARTSQLRARTERAEAELRTAEQGIVFQVTEVESKLRDATERIVVAERALTQAQEQYRIAEERLDAGLTKGALSPLLELSDSQTALTQAQTNLINARIDREIARVQLAFVTGESKEKSK